MGLPPVFARLAQQELDTISALFTARAQAMPVHDAQVATEKGKSPTHTLTRHGYQTGWESQLVRLVTGRTPDQPEDPEGSRDAVDKYFHKESLDRKKRGKIEFAEADSVGAFLSPEVEAFALNLARTRAAPLFPNRFGETETSKGRQWQEYTYIDMVVPGPQHLTGVSFVRLKNKPAVTGTEAVQAIHDFIHQKRISPGGFTSTLEAEADRKNLFENTTLSMHSVRLWNRHRYTLRFRDMGALLDYLGVGARWMRRVKVVFRLLNHNWVVHTAYCVDCREQPVPESGAPTLKSGKWTGNLRKVSDGPVTYVNPETLA